MEYFEVLGLEPVRLNLDLQALEARFYDLSRQMHPDRNLGKPPSDNKMALINRAYKVLRNPWERAYYVTRDLEKPAIESHRLALAYFELQDSGDKQAYEEFRNLICDEIHICTAKRDELFKRFDSGEKDLSLRELRVVVDQHRTLTSMLADIDTQMDAIK